MTERSLEWWWKKGLLTALVLTLLHHTDHVLRQDHSGWPFTGQVTPFTYSLLIYPVLGIIFWLRHRKPYLQAVLLLILTGFILFAHTAVETPGQQYGTWAHDIGTVDPGEVALPNKLDVHSPVLGVLAAIVAALADITFVVLTIFLFVRARQLKSQARE